MKIKNPILPGFNPDPCICYGKGKYYIATSTFETFPGLSIYESEDLANWHLVSRPLNEKRIIDIMNNAPSSGVWAPDLTYHNGKFYIVFSNVETWCTGPFKDCYNYLICAEDIEGPWSDPIFINASGFDASLFHDTDGKSYFVNMEWDYRGLTGRNCFTGILVQEIELSIGKLFGECHKVFKGTEEGFIEGPHIYKKEDYYYLFCAEGGTGYNHSETVSRSKHIFGPYETNGVLITSKNTDAPLQRAGHASLVYSEKNDWLIAHLCGRPIDGKCILGRETALQNIVWKDDWPYLADFSKQPRDYYELKDEVQLEKEEKLICYDFLSKQFSLDFQNLRVDMNPYAIKTNTSLTLIGKQSVDSFYLQNTWQRRQQHFQCEFGCQLSFEPEIFSHMAGLVYRYQEGDLYLLYATYDEKLGKVIRLMTQNEYQTNLFEDIKIQYENDIYLKIVVHFKEAQFYYSFDNMNYIAVGPFLDATKLSDQAVKRGGFTGAFFGLHCADFKESKKTATFRNVYYKIL